MDQSNDDVAIVSARISSRAVTRSQGCGSADGGSPRQSSIVRSVAAGACAQALVGLKHHAAMLDLIALPRIAPVLAAHRVARLQAVTN